MNGHHRHMGNGLAAILVSIIIVEGGWWSKAGAENFQASVQEEDVTLTVGTKGKAEYTVHRRIQIYSPGGRNYGDICLVETSFQEIGRFEATVYGPDGAVRRTVRKKDGQKICGFAGYQLYSDQCLRVFSLTNDAFPYVVDYAYTVKYSSLYFWPDYQPQMEIPVASSVYTLTVPQGFDFHTRVTGDAPSPDTIQSGKTITYVYRMTDVPAAAAEDYPLAPLEAMAGISFAPTAYTLGDYSFRGEEWPQLGRDCYTMFQPALTIGEGPKIFVDSIRAIASSPKDLCYRLHRALMHRMRYVAVEVGIGGWRPHSALQTFASCYGDCKDLSILETALLREAGIEAHPTLIYVHADKRVHPDFPSLTQFNHVVLFAVIESDTLWMDPTVPYCEAGELPGADENQYVLLIDSAAPCLMQTPGSRPEDNVIARTAEVRINADRSMSVKLTLSGTGNVRLALLSRMDVIDKRELNQLVPIFGLSDNFIIDSTRCVVCEADSGRFTLAVTGRAANAVLSASGKQYVDVNFLMPQRNRERVNLDDRTMTIDLSYPFTLLDTITVTLPAGAHAADQVSDTVFSSAFGELRQQAWTEGGKTRLVRQRKSYLYAITPDHFDAFGQYRDELTRRIVHRMTLVKP